MEVQKVRALKSRMLRNICFPGYGVEEDILE